MGKQRTTRYCGDLNTRLIFDQTRFAPGQVQHQLAPLISLKKLALQAF
jgi:hypothetical protein